MSGDGAGEALGAAIVGALSAVPGIGIVYDHQPQRAAFPHVVVESGIESDWGHKNGDGREVRVAVVVRDGGERPVRVRALADAAEAATAGVGRELGRWSLVNLQFLRRRTVPGKPGWAVVIECRGRLLKI